MSRPSWLSICRPFVVLVLALPGGSGVPRLWADALDTKELARAKLAATQSTLEDLRQAKFEVARAEYQAREKEFLAGRGTLDIFREAMLHLLQSALAVSTSEADRIGSLERHWERAKQVEDVNRTRSEAGRISVKEYLEARADRLEAARRLTQALARAGGVAALVGGERVKLDPLNSKELARAKFEATQSNPAELARAKLEAAFESYESRRKEFQAGRGTLDILLESSRQLAEAELAVRDQQEDRVAVFEWLWARALMIETINQVRFEAGRIDVPDYLQSRYGRLEAEIQWAQARAKQPDPFASTGERRMLGLWDDPFEAKELAKAKHAASQANPAEQVRAKLEAARGEYQAREKHFLAGRGMLDILLEASRHWLESEQVLRTTQADRVAVLERSWERALLMERVNRARFERGRITIQDYLQTKYHRLEVEIWLKTAREAPASPQGAQPPSPVNPTRRRNPGAAPAPGPGLRPSRCPDRRCLGRRQTSARRDPGRRQPAAETSRPGSQSHNRSARTGASSPAPSAS
jgi:hypothetical protein